jgi:hypothetical protein
MTNDRAAHGLTGPAGEPLEGATRMALEIIKTADGYDFFDREPVTMKAGAVSIVIDVPDHVSEVEHLDSIPTGRKAIAVYQEAAE